MTKLVVDTNIVFSAILNLNSRIAQILLTCSEHYDFYAPKYIRSEIWEHQQKIKKITGLNDEEFIEVYELVLKNITILNHSIVGEKNYKFAIELCKTIDVDDTVFVAFSNYLNCKLWTGDKKLINGLKKKGFNEITTTEELFNDFLERNNK